MSQDYFFKNIKKNEYIKASGNGNFADSLRWDNPEFITWVMLEKWLGEEVICVVEHEMPGGYDFILKAKNVTEEFRKDFKNANKWWRIKRVERNKNKVSSDPKLVRCSNCKKAFYVRTKNKQRVTLKCSYCKDRNSMKIEK